MTIGGIVLAGGRSARMGSEKAFLDWHGTPLLAHVCAVVSRGTGGGPIVVVRSPGQEIPPLPDGVRVVEDAVEGVGPMQGLLDGLRALDGAAEAAFLAGTDAPFLSPAYVEAVAGALVASPRVDAVIPYVRSYRHPLLAAYRVSSSALLARGIDEGKRRAGLIYGGRLRLLLEAELLSLPVLARQDPGLLSVEDVDTPAQLEAARGRPLPVVDVRVGAGTALRQVRAARLGQAATAVGVGLECVRVALDGTEIVPDPALPLCAGDVVSFLG